MRLASLIVPSPGVCASCRRLLIVVRNTFLSLMLLSHQALIPNAGFRSSWIHIELCTTYRQCLSCAFGATNALSDWLVHLTTSWLAPRCAPPRSCLDLRDLTSSIAYIPYHQGRHKCFLYNPYGAAQPLARDISAWAPASLEIV